MPIAIDAELKKIIENNPISLATADKNAMPNVIGTIFVQVVADNQILFTNRFMTQTAKNIEENEHVCIAVWNQDCTYRSKLTSCAGWKLVGTAKYYTTGKWKKFVEQDYTDRIQPMNLGLPAPTGCILMTVEKIIALH